MSTRVAECRDGARWTRYSLAWDPKRAEALVQDELGSVYPIHVVLAEQAIDLHEADSAWSETIDRAMRFSR